MSRDLLAAYLESGGLKKLRSYARKIGHKFNITNEESMDLLNDALEKLTVRADKFVGNQEGSPMIQMARWSHAAVYWVFVDNNRKINGRDFTKAYLKDDPENPYIAPSLYIQGVPQQLYIEDLPPETPELLYEPLQDTDDLRRDLRTAFLQIEDPETRLIADMVLVQGMTVREVAAVIDRPRSTVLDRLTQARTELRETLKDYRPKAE